MKNQITTIEYFEVGPEHIEKYPVSTEELGYWALFINGGFICTYVLEAHVIDFVNWFNERYK